MDSPFSDVTILENVLYILEFKGMGKITRRKDT